MRYVKQLCLILKKVGKLNRLVRIKSLFLYIIAFAMGVFVIQTVYPMTKSGKKKSTHNKSFIF